MKQALDGNRITDRTTRAHLQESIERVSAALDARVWRTAE
jgi:hypothetical protein